MLDRGLGFWRRTDWLARTATTAAVTLVAVGVTVAAPGEPGHRRVDLLAVGVLLVASLAVGAAGRFPRLAFAASLAGVGAYQALDYSIQSPYFLPLFLTAYAAGLAGGRVQALAFALTGFLVFLAAGLASVLARLTPSPACGDRRAWGCLQRAASSRASSEECIGRSTVI